MVANAQARRILIHQECRHPAGAVSLGCHSCHHKEIGHTGVCDEIFAAVQDIGVAFPHGSGLACACVAACIRLRQGKGAKATVDDDITAALFLLLIARNEHRLQCQTVAVQSDRHTRIRLSDLLHDSGLIDMIQPKAAILFRHIHHVQLHLNGFFVDLAGPLSRNIVLTRLLSHLVFAKLSYIFQQLAGIL